MKQFPKLRPSVWDALVVLLVVAAAAVCAVSLRGGSGDDENLTAVISVDGAEVQRVALNGLTETEQVVEGNGYVLHLVLEEEGVRVAESDCPTQDCVHTGSISDSGQSIVCLPARVIVQLEGGAPTGDGPDIVIG